jgi:hypothetical protein
MLRISGCLKSDPKAEYNLGFVSRVTKAIEKTTVLWGRKKGKTK